MINDLILSKFMEKLAELNKEAVNQWNWSPNTANISMADRALGSHYSQAPQGMSGTTPMAERALGNRYTNFSRQSPQMPTGNPAAQPSAAPASAPRTPPKGNWGPRMANRTTGMKFRSGLANAGKFTGKWGLIGAGLTGLAIAGGAASAMSTDPYAGTAP